MPLFHYTYFTTTPLPVLPLQLIFQGTYFIICKYFFYHSTSCLCYFSSCALISLYLIPLPLLFMSLFLCALSSSSFLPPSTFYILPVLLVFLQMSLIFLSLQVFLILSTSSIPVIASATFLYISLLLLSSSTAAIFDNTSSTYILPAFSSILLCASATVLSSYFYIFNRSS